MLDPCLAIDRQHVRNLRRTRGDFECDGQQLGAGDQDLRTRFRSHRAKLGDGQARIERVAHRPHAHDPVPRRDMRLAIPCQCRDAVADTNPETGEQRRHAQTAITQRGVIGPLHPAIGACGDDLCVGIPARRMIQDLVERQRIGLHTTVDHWHWAIG